MRTDSYSKKKGQTEQELYSTHLLSSTNMEITWAVYKKHHKKKTREEVTQKKTFFLLGKN